MKRRKLYLKKIVNDNDNYNSILKGNKIDCQFNVFDLCKSNENWYKNELCKSLLLKKGSRGVYRTFIKFANNVVDFFSEKR